MVEAQQAIEEEEQNIEEEAFEAVEEEHAIQEEAIEAIKEEEQVTKLIRSQCIKASNQIGKVSI